ncbi:MAG: exo-alpha-sialidase [Armatimonadetes bacterium]|nr:exo-alpha-sialidase [Armatimonadota bacterium]
MQFEQATRIATVSGDRTWNGIAGIERTGAGRLWCVFYTGGPKEPDPSNRVVVCRSDDGGTTWTEPRTVAERPGSLACIDPCVWLDPRGRLVVHYTLCSHDFTEPLCLRGALRCNDPDADEPHFEDLGVLCPELGFVFSLNRPALLSDGRLLLPIPTLQDPAEPGQWYFGRPQKLACAISDDGGESWRPSAQVAAPDNWSNENMIVELTDGRLWMLARSRTGFLWQTFSDDRGESWGEVTASDIPNPSARFFIGRLASGRLLLINNPGPGRDPMTVSLSEDDGATWPVSAELMSGATIAYPDVVQDPEGLIHCVMDVDRRHIEYRAFTEDAVAD